jgi:cell division protein FtsA
MTNKIKTRGNKAQMGGHQKDTYIAALDVGTSKVATLIARVNGGRAEVVGVGHRLCLGLDAGMVTNMDATERAIKDSVDQAERTFGEPIERVLVNVSSGGLHADALDVDVGLGGHPVEQADVERVLAAARNKISGDDERLVLHAQPACYSVDGAYGIVDPFQMRGERLGVDVLVVSAEPGPVHNLEMCVNKAHLHVEQFVAAPLAAGFGCLSTDEMELGCAVVEMGAGVTNVAIFKRGMLVGCSTIMMGGADITDHLCRTLMTPKVHAERLKTLHGAVMTAPKDNQDYIDVPPISNDHDMLAYRMSKAKFADLIRERLQIILQEVAYRLDELGFRGPDAREVVLTGGGSQLTGLAEYASLALGKSVRIGRPQGLMSLPEAASGPGFTLAAGMIRYALTTPDDARSFHYVETQELPRNRIKRFTKWLLGTW